MKLRWKEDCKKCKCEKCVPVRIFQVKAKCSKCGSKQYTGWADFLGSIFTSG
ncbi:hypothetical protein [Francisella marina]|uniref:hypothetical protein n=1 Tax=Francisella marina TaxID=2249302 RepID=UPI00165E45B7|nr:hypothetical protein [Francisella marina]